MKNHVICIGAQRTSTTRLFQCLKVHPDIYLRDEKEVHYFNAVCPPHKNIAAKKPLYPVRLFIRAILTLTDHYARSQYGIRRARKYFLRGRSVPEYYRGIFNTKLKASCDITPAYSILSPIAIEVIKDTVPDAKILFILRDPIERMWSEINYFNRKVKGDNYAELALDIDYMRTQLTDHHRLRGDYASVYRMYSEKFKDIKLVNYEDMNLQPRQVMSDICDFIGVDDSDSILDAMPIDVRVNDVIKPDIPPDIENLLLEFHRDNYVSCIKQFGDLVSSWHYYENFA